VTNGPEQPLGIEGGVLAEVTTALLVIAHAHR
jgi:hypothetical protein